MHTITGTGRSTLRRGALAVGLLFTFACAGGGASAPDEARRAGEVARQIRADPSAAAAAVEAAGWSVDDFEALLYRIAADPEAAATYASAADGG
jgi:hypothetical protein